MARPSEQVVDSLHLFALCGFAFAQPLYDLLGRNAEFFVAHHTSPTTIVLFTLTVSFGVPLVLVAIEGAARALGANARAHVHTLLVSALVALITAGGLSRVMPDRGVAALIGAASAGAAGAWAYRQLPPARMFVTVLAPAALLWPLVFLTATPVSRLVFAKRVATSGATGAHDTSVVLVVFDELSTFALLDARGAIDARRHPNFATLAQESIWFPNATSAFPNTERAIPAIVTGVRAERSPASLPIAADHPGNLFTWLSATHELHVAEPLTALCPQALCKADLDTDHTNVRTLASDIEVLYLHAVTPRDLALRHLPSIDGRWSGFSEPRGVTAAPVPPEKPPERDASLLFEEATRTGRPGLFRQAVRAIRLDEKRSLHFIHALLPHHRYHYLPSGLEYSRGVAAEGLGPDGVWTHDEILVSTGHRQYLQQVQLVDRLLGELITKLKSEGLFEKALVIVTSDHGAAFRPGESHRTMTASNYRDLVAIPLFVKLPAQHEGRIDARPVSSLDIVPTIVEVIGGVLPWSADGLSMIAATFPARPLLPFAYANVPPLPTFDVLEEARSTQRRVRLRSVLGEEEGDIVGQSLADLDVQPERSDMQIFSDNFQSFRNVDPATGVIPAMVHGRVAREGSSTAPVELAIAVNGVVRALTRTSAWKDSPSYFAVLLPESTLQAGSNRLDVLLVNRSGGRPSLARISSTIASGLQIRTTAVGEEIETNDGSKIAIEPHIVGWVDRVEEHPDGVTFYGWAADSKTARPLLAIAAFVDDSAIAFGFPQDQRPDVNAALGMPGLTKVSYALAFPRQRLQQGQVRLFGISEDGSAGELQVSEQARQMLSRLK